MKRLVDETTDELTRSLLAAGIEHQPPPGNKAQVIVALGAGGALGLFSSNAFAWLSTTAGKVTAVGVAVGVAGAVWVAAPEARSPEARGETRSSGDAASANATQRRASESKGDAEGAARVASSAPAVDQPADSPMPDARTADARSEGPESVARRLEPAAAGRADDGSTDGVASRPMSSPAALNAAASNRGLSSSALERADAVDADARGTRSGARSRARKLAKSVSSKEKIVASKPKELSGDGVPAAVEAPAGRAPDWRMAEAADLDSEVRLVDEMYWADRHNDREALRRFLERYRAVFPDGQLKKEVAEFAARLERPDTSR